MKNNRLVRLFVLLTLLIASTTSAFAWSIDEMRYEFEYGIKAKDFGKPVREGGILDGTAGASDRSFRETSVSLTVFPFESSEFSITGDFSKRVQGNSTSRRQNSASSNVGSGTNQTRVGTENMENISRGITLGNTWVFGKLMLRPELGMRYTNYKHHAALDKTIEYRIYPKVTYSVTKDLNLYTRGYFGRRNLDRKGNGTTHVNTPGSEKTRMEYGTRYKFNNKNALSVAYGMDKTEETHLNYAVKSQQIRLRYHYTPTRRITIVPHWFIGNTGQRWRANNGNDGTISKSRIGINSNIKATNSITVLAQIHYEWWREPRPFYLNTGTSVSTNSTAPQKDNMFYQLGLKHTF